MRVGQGDRVRTRRCKLAACALGLGAVVSLVAIADISDLRFVEWTEGARVREACRLPRG